MFNSPREDFNLPTFIEDPTGYMVHLRMQVFAEHPLPFRTLALAEANNTIAIYVQLLV
jgi:hypothetical protein